MKKLESSDQRFNVLYAGRKIYSNLSHEDCLEVLQDYAEQFYESPIGEFDVTLLEMEEI